MDSPKKVKITAKDFATKYKSKREVYNFLSADVGVYLPAYVSSLLHSSINNMLFLIGISNNLFSQRYHERKEEK